MTTKTKASRKTKLTRATAVLCGFAAVGFAANAALDWVTSRGDVTTTALNYGMELSTGGFAVLETGSNDTVLLPEGGGYTITSAELANYTGNTVGNAADLSWALNVTSAYPGLFVGADVPHVNTGTTALKFQGLKVLDPAGNAFAPGTAPAVPSVLTASALQCGDSVAPAGTGQLKAGAMLTDAFGAPFQIQAQFVPSTFFSQAQCDAQALVNFPDDTTAP